MKMKARTCATISAKANSRDAIIFERAVESTVGFDQEYCRI
ncbi:hypothetical protein [Paraburkholderia phosphatilytica]|nr:hypothetical protein [Paraburkholderia phosphatilytica]